MKASRREELLRVLRHVFGDKAKPQADGTIEVTGGDGSHVIFKFDADGFLDDVEGWKTVYPEDVGCPWDE